MTQFDLHPKRKLNPRQERLRRASAYQTDRVTSVVLVLFGILELLLGVRVLLHLISTNAENSFMNFVDGLTAPFVVLFANVVQNPILGPSAVLELTTLMAMIVYGVLAWLISRMIQLAMSRPR